MSYSIKELTARIEGMATDMRGRLKIAKTALSHADKTVSTIYHEIENTQLSVVMGYRLAQQLQKALLTRRQIKLELELLQMLSDQLSAVCKRADRRLTYYTQLLDQVSQCEEQVEPTQASISLMLVQGSP